MRKLNEECGIFAIKSLEKNAAGLTYNALIALQHRGQEGAGIAALFNNTIHLTKDCGLVSEAISKYNLSTLPDCEMAIGHVRYSTTGSNTKANVQPMLSDYFKGRIALAHNGNILNAGQIKERLQKEGCDFIASNDSEVISALIAYEINNTNSIEDAVIKAVRQLEGAFCLVILTSKNKIIAVRDGHGFRPLCIGKNGQSIAISSESCALDSLGFEFIRDVKPGEMIVIDDSDEIKSSIIIENQKKSLCIFEYVYFARPDSIIDKLSVYEARINAGRRLAIEHPVDADIVCGVPDSGVEAAMGYALQSGIPYVTGFVKNRYIGRSFIFPTQGQREYAVKMKLNPLKANVNGKRVILVDDSIVRGTTSAKIINNLKMAGAKEVHLRISSPMFKHMCYFGTDIDCEENLIANYMSLEQIRQKINADSLGYISLEGLKDACRKCGVGGLCDGCFTGDYSVNIENQIRKNQLEK